MSFVVDFDKPSLVPEHREIPESRGWEIREEDQLPNVVSGQLEWNDILARIELYLSEKQKHDGIVSGLDLYAELKDRPVLNANLIDFLLDHAELIPDKWENEIICCWGTIYHGLDDFLYVRCLDYDGVEWRWGCLQINLDFLKHPAAILN
jgi:hypothetical protein